MSEFLLPPLIDSDEPMTLPAAKQITIVGANGAGKTRFMRELVRRCPGKAYCLSAVGASYPERAPSTLPGSIDELYASAIKTQPYLRNDAMSEIDKIAYMLFADEFEYLLSVKADRLDGDKYVPMKPTKLDKLRNLWERIFPGNHILRHSSTLMFATDSGENIISTGTLSQGEKAVLYYIGAVLYAMPKAVIFIDSPSIFMHPSILNNLWNAIEELRPDCTFIYNTVDVDFISSRTENVCVWIKSFDVHSNAWDYQVFNPGELTDDVFLELMGSRKPVLFIEGDVQHSIDCKLYTLVFPEYTVRPLGSCDKVIESTRTFNDLKGMHHLESHGLVDRDRRTSVEVEYLRKKQIFVPDVAEVENIFLLENVIRVMARRRGKDPDRVFRKVSDTVMSLFKRQYIAQALMHVRHKVKRDVECKVDARFTCISGLELHLRSLIDRLKPREYYDRLCTDFQRMLRDGDYAGVLRVFNYKPVLPESNVATLLGYPNKDAYIAGVLGVMKGSGKDARSLRAAIKFCFGLDMDNNQVADIDAAPAQIERQEEAADRESEQTRRQNRIDHDRRQSKRQGKRYHRGRKL